MRLPHFAMGFMSIFLFATVCESAPGRGAFKQLATYRGVGSVLRSLVGPGPVPGSERLYLSYIYIGGTLEIVAIDPDTGQHQVYSTPVKSESGAWAIAVGPDDNLYLGTLSRAHILRLNPRTGEFTDMGRPSETEQYIWQLAVGPDRKLYGCTYPSAKLVRFDPATGRGEDLGRMDPTEQYARTIAAGDDGFVYTGIGFSKAHLVAYEIATGRHRDILPERLQVTGGAAVHRGEDGQVYAQAGRQHFRLEGGEPIPIRAADVRPAVTHRLKDGRLITQAGNGVVRVQDPTTGAEMRFPYRYAGKEIDVFRIGMGPDGRLYGSTAMPIHFFQVHPASNTLNEMGEMGGGEFYAFLRYGDYLLGAAYSGRSPLMVYDPRKPFEPGRAAGANPLLVEYGGQVASWRPQAMIAGPDGRIYLGAVAGYGMLGGPLTVWDPATNQVESFHHLVKNQSVVSLAAADGLIVGGTTVIGGGGSHPTEKEAKLFVWDPSTKRTLLETVPVPGATQIDNLITVPGGTIYGMAANKTLFVFDPRTRQVIQTMPLPFTAATGNTYNSVALGPDGNIWGVTGDGIFTIDPRRNTARLVARSPEPITAGFALEGNNLYYASGPNVYCYTLPIGKR
jgi:streptogramin lyase